MLGTNRERAACWWLSALLLLLPFEPRRPTIAVAGFEITLLEAAAAVSGGALLWLARGRLRPLLGRLPLPLVFLALYAVAHALSAALAVENRELAAKFALRMTAMAGFAVVVAALPSVAHRKGLSALVVGASVVATLAVLEGMGVRFLDPLLSHFREMPFNVGGRRRASAGSEYPNLSAAFLMCGLLVATGLAANGRRRLRVLLPLSFLLSCGLLFTYSRGALLAAALSLLLLSVVMGWRHPSLAKAPLVALVVLLGASGVFAWGGEVFRLRLGTEGTQAWYGAVYTPEETTLVLRPGEARLAGVRLLNSGLKTWTDKEAFHLSYHWYDLDRKDLSDGGRTELPADVEPWESVSLRAEIRAPWREGRYLLVWDMVHEHTSWFSGQGVRPAVVPVRVSRAADVAPAPLSTAALDVPLAWRPRRMELWSLALGMWRERPLLGVGPDNFRWLYGPRAGRAFWDTRVFSNNTLLEAAATTGALGLLALTAVLIMTGFHALGRLMRAESGAAGVALAASLFALVTGLIVHGLVDYVLAFTGHYLLLGFAVGAVSASAEDHGRGAAEASGARS